MLLYSNTSSMCTTGTAHAYAFMLCLPYCPLSCSSCCLSHRSTLSKYTSPSIFIDQYSTNLIAAVPILTLPWLRCPLVIYCCLLPHLPKWGGEHKHHHTNHLVNYLLLLHGQGLLWPHIQSRWRSICLTIFQTSKSPPPPRNQCKQTPDGTGMPLLVHVVCWNQLRATRIALALPPVKIYTPGEDCCPLDHTSPHQEPPVIFCTAAVSAIDVEEEDNWWAVAMATIDATKEEYKCAE